MINKNSSEVSSLLNHMFISIKMGESATIESSILSSCNDLLYINSL